MPSASLASRGALTPAQPCDYRRAICAIALAETGIGAVTTVGAIAIDAYAWEEIAAESLLEAYLTEVHIGPGLRLLRSRLFRV